MNASNWINAGLLVATIASGIVAAIAARHAARQSRTAALDARVSAEAGKRSAAALEEANELRREASRKPRWSATRIPDRPTSSTTRGPRIIGLMDNDSWLLTNDGPGTVTDVRVCLRGQAVSADFEGWGTNDFSTDVVDEGLGGMIWVSRFRHRQGQAVLEVSWCDVDGTEQHTALMLA